MRAEDPRRITFADVRRTYSATRARDEWYGDWASALIYRPLSFMLTPLLVRLHASATAVSATMLVLGLALPALAATGGPNAYVAIAAIAFVCMVLDCADGNIARVTDSASNTGAYVDFVADVTYRICAYWAVGSLAEPGGPGLLTIANPLAAASLAACLTLGARLCRFRNGRAVALTFYQPPRDERRGARGVVERYVFPFLSGLDRLLPLLILAAAPFGLLHWLVVWLLVFGGIDFVYTQIVIVTRLRTGA